MSENNPPPEVVKIIEQESIDRYPCYPFPNQFEADRNKFTFGATFSYKTFAAPLKEENKEWEKVFWETAEENKKYYKEISQLQQRIEELEKTVAYLKDQEEKNLNELAQNDLTIEAFKKEIEQLNKAISNLQSKLTEVCIQRDELLDRFKNSSTT